MPGKKNNNTGLTYFVPSTEGLDAKPGLPARPEDRDLSHAWPKKKQPKNPTGLTYFVSSAEGQDAKPGFPVRTKDRDVSHAWLKKHRSDILCVLSGGTRSVDAKPGLPARPEDRVQY